MSDEAIIRVENLGKRYRISHQPEGRRYVALRDVIAEKAKGIFKGLKPETGNRNESQVSGLKSQAASRATREDFWALKDVSFEVKRGEVVGIIGRNGAGKSTLLKILSRITEPTEGEVRLRGRVASLLEVGTGFHPELTGRENIFLNGAILGMSKAEIKRKFDEMVAFAEVEKFLDTPVKRYSSGMYVRLAFAVAAHLEPEILIVDEVLAVGDAEFQKKCLGKMQAVAKGNGRTVLFVSHSLGAISGLCKTCAYLESGKLKDFGRTADVVQSYLSDCSNLQSVPRGGRELGGGITLLRFEMTPTELYPHRGVAIILELDSATEQTVLELCLLLFNQQGQRVSLIDFRNQGRMGLSPKFTAQFTVQVQSLPLVEGHYSLGIWIDAPTTKGDFLDLATFEIHPQDLDAGTVRYPPHARGQIDLLFTQSISSVLKQPAVSSP